MRLSLLATTAMIGTASAAVVTNPFVQNKAANWSHRPGATASQGSTSNSAPAPRAIDSNYNGAWSGGSVTHTDPAFAIADQWWQVDLGTPRDITEITLFNRTDCCGGRLSNYSVLAGNDPNFASTIYDSGNQADTAGASISFTGIGTVARYVRVQRNATSNHGDNVLSLAEVDVLGLATFSFPNLAAGSTASQSSTLINSADPTAAKAIDGNLNPSFGSGSTTHTIPGDTGNGVWWETSLASISDINEIALYNRGDCCQDRLSNFRVSIYDGATEVWGENYFEGSGQAGDIFAIQEDTGGTIATGDRVRIELIGGTNNAGSGTDVLSLREVEIFGTAVPEPSAALLAGLAALGLLRRRRP